MIFRSRDSITPEVVALETSSHRRLSLGPCHQSETPNSPNTISRKASPSLWDYRVDSIKTIIWLHNLTISHLETDYCHNSGTLFVDCPKITEGKSSESRVQTPDAKLIITTSAASRRGLRPASQHHYNDQDAEH